MTDKITECKSCGAELKFAPGAGLLKCPYCGAEQTVDIELEASDEVWEEKDFRAVLADLAKGKEATEVATTHCRACGAHLTWEESVASDECPYCGATVVREMVCRSQLKPQALLPFQIPARDARDCFRRWIGSLWFAPTKLKTYARSATKLVGVYVPYWTYDSRTLTRYRGERGEHYWVTESYRDAQGKRQTRRVRKTRWYSAAGIVQNQFDDVLVLASESLPRQYTEKLEPWDLKALVPHQVEYLSGFRSESYTIGLEAGFERAKQLMQPTIDATIRQDIGGDEQRIHSRQVSYQTISFKHILLPVWVSAYRFKDKVYRFLINARTGEVQGERPWSWVKITTAVVAVMLIIALIALFAGSR